MKVDFKNFESIREFIKFLDRPENIHFQDINKSSQNVGLIAEKFTKTESYEQALNLLKNGWDEGAKKIKTVFDRKAPQLINKSKSYNSVVGYQANIPNYLNNSPLSMINKKTVKVQSPVVTIVRELSVPGRISSDFIMSEGIKFLKYIADLESQGQRAKIILQDDTVDYRNNTSYNNIVRIVIKHPDELLHIGKLAFPIAHPSMLRRILFRYTEVNPETPECFTYSYGQPNKKVFLKDGEILYKDNWN